jgi:hypothetical protein
VPCAGSTPCTLSGCCCDWPACAAAGDCCPDAPRCCPAGLSSAGRCGGEQPCSTQYLRGRSDAGALQAALAAMQQHAGERANG